MPNSIALFTWGLSESGGAITNIVAALAKGFDRFGVKQIYIVYLNDAEDRRIDLPESVELVPLGVSQTKLSALAIAKFIRQYQPDIFISLAFLNIPSLVGYLLAGKVKTKLVISQQNSLIYQARVEQKDNWLFKVQLWLAKYLYPLADGLVATTKPVLQELLEEMKINFDRTEIAVIPNIVDVNKIAAEASNPASHPWLQLKDIPVIVSVARLAKQKNFPLLINALKKVRQELEVKLIIYGEGSERENIENLVQQLGLEDVVSLPGNIPAPHIEMAKADAFILSSEEEAFGLVIVEAMASGTPVVVTDAIGEGPKTIIGDSQYGLLIPNNDHEALSEAIIRILSDRQLREYYINTGSDRCQIYRPEIIAKQWLTLADSL